MSEAESGNVRYVDLRKVAAESRRPLVFEAFERLAPGDRIELVHHHHSTPLKYLMLAEFPREVRWEYLESGPDRWRILLRKEAQHTRTTTAQDLN